MLEQEKRDISVLRDKSTYWQEYLSRAGEIADHCAILCDIADAAALVNELRKQTPKMSIDVENSNEYIKACEFMGALAAMEQALQKRGV